jgi:hypothetical protein
MDRNKSKDNFNNIKVTKSELEDIRLIKSFTYKNVAI